MSVQNKKAHEIRVDSEKRRAILSVIYREGGEATFKQIAEKTSMTRPSADYQFSQLAEDGLIEIEWTDAPRGEGTGMRVGVLTAKTEKYVRLHGGFEDTWNKWTVMSEDELRSAASELEAEVSRAHERLDSVSGLLSDGVKKELRQVQGRLLRLESELERVSDEDLRTLEEVLEKENIGDEKREKILEAFS